MWIVFGLKINRLENIAQNFLVTYVYWSSSLVISIKIKAVEKKNVDANYSGRTRYGNYTGSIFNINDLLTFSRFEKTNFINTL